MLVSEMGYIYWEPGRMQKVSEYVMKSEGAEVLGLLKTRFVEGLNKEKPVCTEILPMDIDCSKEKIWIRF